MKKVRVDTEWSREIRIYPFISEDDETGWNGHLSVFQSMNVLNHWEPVSIRSNMSLGSLTVEQAGKLRDAIDECLKIAQEAERDGALI